VVVAIHGSEQGAHEIQKPGRRPRFQTDEFDRTPSEVDRGRSGPRGALRFQCYRVPDGTRFDVYEFELDASSVLRRHEVKCSTAFAASRLGTSVTRRFLGKVARSPALYSPDGR